MFISAGELHLYPVPVKTQSGEKLELQLKPGGSVIDVKQFLLDAPETCFYTCYDLILHTKDGSTHQLEDYNEISKIADITCGGCSFEMVAGIYDERSIRSHLRRVRELLSLSSLHVSLSTSLALQQESTQEKSTDSGKTTVQKLDGLHYMEDTSSALTNLLTSAPSEIKCIESIVFSSFNPPPSYRRLHGDLIYIDVLTLEGNKYCITGNSKSFYVNRSNGNILDPRPTKQALESSTLVGLLQKISAKFKKGFHEVLDRRASAHPFENVQSLLPVTSWLGAYPVPDCQRDAARDEDSVVLSYGTEFIGMQRDWNEEVQSCREFPHGNPQERIIRDRALYKVTSDFVDAAVNGAIGAIDGSIPPINPTDPECFHMYVHNNIFFSFAIDSDYEHISKDQKPDCQNGSSKSIKVSPPVVVAKADKNHAGSGEAAKKPGELHTSDDASAEPQLADNEQATYASANNDLKGTKAYQEADISGLYNLAMAIIDYRGHRVVAQSIIPGILQGDKSDSLLYGSGDNGKKISWNESFHSKVVEAATRLHLKEHLVLDGSGDPVKLAATVECKGIVGSDDRHYILDLMRVTPRDSNYIGQDHRFCVLRPEIVSSFVEAESTKHSPKQKVPNAPEESDDQVASTSDSMATSVEGDDKSAESSASRPENDSSSEILFNPNVLTEYKLAGSPEEIAADEELVRKAGTYLVDIVIPKFVQELCSLEISPIDGQSLTDVLHLHGINVRYLGKIAGLIKHLPHLWDLFCSEIIVRSAKHVIKEILRQSPDHDVGPAIAHFLNCFLGKTLSASTKGSVGSTQSETQKGHEKNSQTQISSKAQKQSHGAASRAGLSAYSHLTSDSIWSKIKEFAKYKYQFDVPDEARLGANRVVVLRNLCQKVGITIAARKYDLDASTPFQPSDIFNLQPVIKHSVPTCTDARNLMEAGKIRMAEGTLNEAYALFSEAFSLLQQITGPMHKDAANCCRYLAMVLYHAGDTAGAIVQQHRELIINERCLGLDHPDTAHSYGNMALFYHGLNQTELALRHMSRTLLLLSLASGPSHPDVAATLINVAMMYQDAGNMNTALRYLQEALMKNERLLGPDHIQTAVCYHALAIAFNCMGAYKLSIQHEKKTYDILAKQLGEDDSRTKDSENWLNTFKLREQQVNAQKQKGQGTNPSATAIDFLKLSGQAENMVLPLEFLQHFKASDISNPVEVFVNLRKMLNGYHSENKIDCDIYQLAYSALMKIIEWNPDRIKSYYLKLKPRRADWKPYDKFTFQKICMEKREEGYQFPKDFGKKDFSDTFFSRTGKDFTPYQFRNKWKGIQKELRMRKKDSKEEKHGVQELIEILEAQRTENAETISSQRERIETLEIKLADATQKLKMSDLMSMEACYEHENQKKMLADLQSRLEKAQQQIMDGDKLRKKLQNTILELKGNIRVFCRVRPLLLNESGAVTYPKSGKNMGRGIELTHNALAYSFTFDKVFDDSASQEDIFIEISELVQSALDGNKVCIFAYGPTGSGKTYTMMGNPEVKHQKGMIPRSLEMLFQAIQDLSQGWKYKMQVSMLEIYNETIRDLLSTSPVATQDGGSSKYNIKLDASGNTYVSDLTVVDVTSISEVSSLLRRAAQSRSVGRTQMNEESSRSHCVFTLRISGVKEGGQKVQGVLNLIDLAGSERLKTSGATGDGLKETQAINKSLSYLCDAICAIKNKNNHIPFRNSKLTYLLQPYLGGNSKTLMFVNLSPESSSTDCSLCALRFAESVNSCEIANKLKAAPRHVLDGITSPGGRVPTRGARSVLSSRRAPSSKKLL